MEVLFAIRLLNFLRVFGGVGIYFYEGCFFDVDRQTNHDTLKILTTELAHSFHVHFMTKGHRRDL